MAPLVEASIRVGSVHVGSSVDSGLHCAALDWVLWVLPSREGLLLKGNLDGLGWISSMTFG